MAAIVHTVLMLLITSPALTTQTLNIQSLLNTIQNAISPSSESGRGSWGGAVKDWGAGAAREGAGDWAGPVQEGWGVPDQTAVAGRLFSYELPSQMFNADDGQAVQVKIEEIENGKLPDWMFFDQLTNQLLGVPSEDSIGRRHYLELTTSHSTAAAPDTAQPGVKKDLFSVKVVEDSDHLSTADKLNLINKTGDASTLLRPGAAAAARESSPRRIKCPAGASITRASVAVAGERRDLSARSAVALLADFARHLGMPRDLVRVVPLGSRPVVDSGALVAGAGDGGAGEYGAAAGGGGTGGTGGTVLQWEVGCGNVQAFHMPVLQTLETSAVDGSMRQAIGKSVLGWQVTNNRPAPKTHRLKRRAARPPAAMSGGREARAARESDLYDGEGSGFYAPTDGAGEAGVTETAPPEVVRTRRPPRPGRTRKPRPTKTRHHHKTRKPKPTKPTVVVTTLITETDRQRSTETPQPAVVTDGQPVETPAPPTALTTSTSSTATAPTTTTRTTPATEREIPVEDINYPPKVINEIPLQEVTVGDVLNYRIPPRTFSDKEDGNTRRLDLKMLTIENFSLANNSWVQFNDKKQTIIGIPMDSHVGTYEYLIIAVDKNNQLAHEKFQIKVNRRPAVGDVNHEFSAKLDLNYDRFMQDVNQRLDVTKKIASVYGDKDMSKISITKISRGSVDYAWTNNSLPTDGCPVDDINNLLSYLVNSNNSLNQNFVDKMKPYKVLGAGAFPKGVCDDQFGTTTDPSAGVIFGEPTKRPASDGDRAPNEVDEGEVKAQEPRRADDRFITTIIPVVVITTMVLLAVIIVCCLWRRNRRGKQLPDDARDSTFTSKGIPVIFADELEEKPAAGAGRPLLLKEERPPQPPPEYPRSSSGGSLPSTPGSQHREPLLADSDRYQRGAGGGPANGSTGSMSRRLPNTPGGGYRQPPPYASVPP